jgi:small-conductance mechanosensitive channel
MTDKKTIDICELKGDLNMSLKKIIKVILLLVLLFVFFHPILSIIMLVKFGGIVFAIGAIMIVLKLVFGKTIIDLISDRKD